MQGNSVNFIESFGEFKEKSQRKHLTLSFYGDNGSKEFNSVENILFQKTGNISDFYYMQRHGGIQVPFKIYDPWDLNMKNYRNMIPFNQFNFSSYFSDAERKKYIKKKGSEIQLFEDFFISIDDVSANNFMFGNSNRIGQIIDIDNAIRSQNKRSIVQKFTILENIGKMIINVDSITSSQEERRRYDNDVGFYVFSSPGNLVNSIGVKGIDIVLTRKNEIQKGISRL